MPELFWKGIDLFKTCTMQKYIGAFLEDVIKSINICADHIG